MITCGLLDYMINKRSHEKELPKPSEPFVVSEYYDRIEKAALDIMENQEPVDQTIVLWWGLDGLRLNEDGTLEWVSRRKQKPVQKNVFYQLCKSVPAYNPDFLAQTQSTRALIDDLMAQNASLQMQALQAQQRTQLINSLQQCCVQHPPQYTQYI